jgi:hypothetical protein
MYIGRDLSLINCLLITVAIVLLTKYEMPVFYPNPSNNTPNLPNITFLLLQRHVVVPFFQVAQSQFSKIR